MKIEINKELVLSNTHVTREEFYSLDFINYSSDEDNIRLHVESVLDEIEESGEYLTKHDNIQTLCVLAKSLDCKWLVLDCDGVVSEDLKTFSW